MVGLVLNKVKNLKISNILGQKQEKAPENNGQKPEMRAYMPGYFSQGFAEAYNGEKNLGEAGEIKEYYMDYQALRMRSWQSYLESEITQTVINRYTKWIIGSGLKVKSEPNAKFLQANGIQIDPVTFTSNIEHQFSVYANSTLCDYAGMHTLNHIAKRIFINAKVGGDVLVVLRVKDGLLKIQMIDGGQICDEYGSSEYFPIELENGNKLVGGIEISPSGEHVAYHVKTGTYNLNYVRVDRKNSMGMVQAFLVGSSLKLREANYRCIPSISAILETLKKLERYKEATVGSAEEQNKIPYTIERGSSSDGTTPLAGKLAKAYDLGNSDQIAKDINDVQLADNIAATTNKNVFDMPIDTTLKSLDAKMQLYFKEFYGVNEDSTFYTVGIPPDVARSKYDSNFSASRAALKDWEHTLLVERADFTEQFYGVIYDFWFALNVMQNNIQAPGYSITSRTLINEAYTNCRFIGVGVPHIDPEKEARAERIKQGDILGKYPMTTIERSTEKLGDGDSEQNFIQVQKELQELTKIMPEPEPVNTPTQSPE